MLDSMKSGGSGPAAHIAPRNCETASLMTQPTQTEYLTHHLDGILPTVIASKALMWEVELRWMTDVTGRVVVRTCVKTLNPWYTMRLNTKGKGNGALAETLL